MALQDVDKKLFELYQKSNLPSDIDQYQEAADEAQALATEFAENHEELLSAQRRHQHDLSADTVALKEGEARFASVTTNKEYDALQLEVEVLRSSIANHEDRLLRLVDEIARTSQDLAAAQAEAAELLQDLEHQVGTRQSDQVTIDGQLEDLEMKRSIMKNGIDAEENVEIVRMLVRAGADRTVKDDFGHTPALLARNAGYLDTAKLLAE